MNYEVWWVVDYSRPNRKTTRHCNLKKIVYWPRVMDFPVLPPCTLGSSSAPACPPPLCCPPPCCPSSCSLPTSAPPWTTWVVVLKVKLICPQWYLGVWKYARIFTCNKVSLKKNTPCFKSTIQIIQKIYRNKDFYNVRFGNANKKLWIKQIFW